MQKIARSVYFKDGKAIGAGFTVVAREADSMVVMELPTDHYDFLGPINVKGKSKEEIEKELLAYM